MPGTRPDQNAVRLSLSIGDKRKCLVHTTGAYREPGMSHHAHETAQDQIGHALAAKCNSQRDVIRLWRAPHELVNICQDTVLDLLSRGALRVSRVQRGSH